MPTDAPDDELTAGQKAARTKRDRYGANGLRQIAERANRTRAARRDQRLTELEAHLARSAAGARARARTRGLDYHDDLPGWALATMEAQRYRCALSGVEFRLDILGHGRAPRPFAPSIDRVDATRGYTADNIRIICWAANCLLGTWGDGPALEIGMGMAANPSARRG